MSDSANTFKSMKAGYKDSYSGEEKLKHLKKILGYKEKNKATAELEASEDPEAYMAKSKNPSWKSLKGVAF